MDTTAKDASNTTAVYISGKSDKSPKNKRKSPDTKNLRADVDERAEGYADEETDGLVGGKEAAGEDKPKRKKRKKKVRMQRDHRAELCLSGIRVDSVSVVSYWKCSCFFVCTCQIAS